MKQVRIVILLFSAATFFIYGCVLEQGIDKAKFSDLNRTVQDLKIVIASNSPCDAPAELQQRLAAGIAAVKDRTASRPERELITAYSNLLAVYQDGLLLCRYRNQLTDFQFVPKGRIYVSQELDPIVEKYELSTEKHQYKPTGQYWRSVPGDSIRVIWSRAQNQIKNIETILKYN